jgi:hypothetical protein
MTSNNTMTTETIVRDDPARQDPLINRSFDYWNFPSLCWGAIIGGTVAAIGIHVLLTLLGMGAGLAAFSPRTDADPVTHFNLGAALIFSACALVSLWFGGLIAGRYSRTWHGGFVHGILVWSLTLIITLVLLTKGTGMLMGGGLRVVGESLGIGGQAAVSTLANVGQDATRRSGDQLNSFLTEASQSIPTNAAPADVTRAKREIQFAVTKLFAPENQDKFQDNRQAAIQAVVNSAHMSEADATKTVDEWINSYNELKGELEHAKQAAEQKARDVADQTARDVSHAASWVFFALLIGLIVTALGGVCGARVAARRQTNYVPS